MGRRSVVVTGHNNRYDELSQDLQAAIDRLINTMASTAHDEIHASMINTLRKQIIHCHTIIHPLSHSV